MKAIQIYKHVTNNNIFGIADKIKQERKSLNKRKNANRR